MRADLLRRDGLPPALPGFDNVRRFRNAAGQWVARLLPGDFYVTCQDEMLETVLGSCVSACIRHPRLGIGGMNHFMLPTSNGGTDDSWGSKAPGGGGPGRATRYGSASMEHLINRILESGGLRRELEVKIFGGGRVLAGGSDVGAHNVKFVIEYLRQEDMRIEAQDVGNTVARQLQYFPLTGRVRVRHLSTHQEVASSEQQYLHGLERAPIAGEIDLF
jgi:chemotaxis protein CheD